MTLLAGNAGSYAQFITVLLIFVLVLGVTALTTRWIANYQKQQSDNVNIQVIETTRIANSKYIQIVRIGETYMAVVVCKDTVTMLGEIPKEQLKEGAQLQAFRFKEFFDKAVKKTGAESLKTEEDRSDDET